MTTTETPSRELDARIAEKVHGWKWYGSAKRRMGKQEILSTIASVPRRRPTHHRTLRTQSINNSLRVPQFTSDASAGTTSPYSLCREKWTDYDRVWRFGRMVDRLWKVFGLNRVDPGYPAQYSPSLSPSQQTAGDLLAPAGARWRSSRGGRCHE